MTTFPEDFRRSVHAEMLKSRKTIALILTILFPFFSVCLTVLSQYGIDFKDSNPWTRYVYNISNLSSFFLPFFLILIIGFYCHIEHKSNTWKHLLAQPVRRTAVYSGKLFMILILLAASIGFFMVFAYLGTQILLWSKPAFRATGIPGPDYLRLLLLFLKIYFAASVIIAVQYWLSIRFRNLILPIVIGVALVILPIATLVVLGMTGLVKEVKLLEGIFTYDPYSYPFVHIFNFMKAPAQEVEVFPRLSLLYFGMALLIFLISLWDFRRKNVK